MGCCLDCKTDIMADYYMVHAEIWCRAVDKEDRQCYLCTACLEHRLGRPLTADDFSNAPINEQYFRNRERKNMI